MFTLRSLLGLAFLGLAFLALPAAAPALAQGDGQPSLEVYTVGAYTPLPVKEIHSRTVIDGPLAQTRLAYRIGNDNPDRSEIGFNLHVPQGTVLHAFGYFYKGRFIPGKMYDNDEAWKIYQAVTSRGRDPGIMDRPTAQDYHTQVYPVEARHDLRVIVELTQALSTDRQGAHFELPLTQGEAGYEQQRTEAQKRAPVEVRAETVVLGHPASQIADNFGTAGATHNGSAVLRLSQNAAPTENWRVTVRRQTQRAAQSVCSALSRRGGFYALSVSAPYPLVRPRVLLSGSPGTNLSLPTRFGTIRPYQNLTLTGTYRRPQRVAVTILSAQHRPLHFHMKLSGRQVAERQNPAGVVWADKRIDALQGSNRPQVRTDVVRLSKRFTVVSRFTALLAIPKEELAYYKTVLAKQKVSTNTRYMGGGGGDPYIAVKAPADSQRVVAVFPNGDVKELAWNGQKLVWEGRFDIPFGTPAGDYRVTVIVVHADGLRSRFLLVYENLLSGPQAGTLTALRARPGTTLPIHVTGTGIARAVAVAPWGERVSLESAGDGRQAALHIPADWPAGQSQVTIVLLDGAHNRTEVTLDLTVE